MKDISVYVLSRGRDFNSLNNLPCVCVCVCLNQYICTLSELWDFLFMYVSQ